MKDIVVEQVSKRFGEKRVLEHFSAVFAGGETTCIMGDSGCGKTTLLNLLMGFEKADGGRITGVPEHMSTVFQEDRLCEAFGAVSNIRLVLGRKVPAEWIRDHLRELGLDGDAFDKPVSEFSGGMKRRVALARAVSYGGMSCLWTNRLRDWMSQRKKWLPPMSGAMQQAGRSLW